MATLTVTKLRVISTRGDNKRPSYGEVTFSDGKDYMFLYDPDGSLNFFGYKTYLADTSERHSVHFSFKSAKRAEVLEAYLNV